MTALPAAARALALALATALALPMLAEDPVVAVVPPASDAAVIESARLDAAVIEQSAALEVFGLSSAASTALVVVVIAVVLTVATSSGDSQGIPP
jgi:hypothetical protein